jgi:DNA-binding CsgD family transcriptional regulator
MASGTASGVVGRARELAAVAAFVERGAAGPAALLLEGDAGIGKTTLWLAGVGAAEQQGRPVLQARPAEAESRLAFAGLGDLLEGVLDDAIGGLAPPQAAALRVALLLEPAAGAPPDERALGVALLSLLRRLAGERPVLVAVDDVQWLDAASARVLAFAWRRLRSEPVALLLARRVGSPVVAPLDLGERLAVEPLSMGALHRLLHDRLGLILTRPALRRVHAASGGNPFYALELGRATEPATGEPPPVPERLRDLVLARLETLPVATTDALAAAAALVRPTIGLVVRAQGGDDALRPALAAQVLELDGDRIRFSHPLLAAGAYERLDKVARRELHERLAALVDDDEERWRHRALAATGPDATVAAGLERAAEHARRRGASSSAAELCELAYRLTPPEQRHDVHRRTLAAGFHRWVAGDMGGACTLFAQAAEAAPSGRLRAEAMAAQARALAFEGDQRNAARIARLAMAEPDAGGAVRAEAAQAVCWAAIFLREALDDGVQHAALAVRLAEQLGDRALEANALGVQGLLEAALGRPSASATFTRAIALGDVADPVRRIRSPRFDYAAFLMWADALDDSAAILRAFRDQALTADDSSSLPLIQAQRALVSYLAGRWPEAAAFAEEGYELALQTGERPQQALSLSALALVRASEGRESEARAHAEAALAIAGEQGMAAARIHAVWALALLDASLERPDEVVGRLAPERERLLAAGVREPGSIRFLGEEVEALVQLGRLDDAEVVLGWLEETGRALDRASALASASRCRGLLAAAQLDPPGAVVALERALDEHARAGMPFETARTQLCLGAAQRRAGHRRDARATLEAARATFAALGARPWRERAEGELRRIGGRHASGDELTPAERRVADLVAHGDTNRQVAAALFLSPKTVEAHLRSIFRKLGVRSRSELTRRVLGEQR